MTDRRHFLTRFYDAVGDLPSVQFRVLWLTALDAGTLTWGIVLCFSKNSKDSVPVFNAWLYFLAALHGVAVTGYGVKRFSAWQPKEDAGAPPPAPLTTTTTTAEKVVSTIAQRVGSEE